MPCQAPGGIEMNSTPAAGGEGFDVAYLVISGTTTAARCPELLRGLVGIGFATVIALPTPNTSRVVALRDLADVPGAQVVDGEGPGLATTEQLLNAVRPYVRRPL